MKKILLIIILIPIGYIVYLFLTKHAKEAREEFYLHQQTPESSAIAIALGKSPETPQQPSSPDSPDFILFGWSAGWHFGANSDPIPRMLSSKDHDYEENFKNGYGCGKWHRKYNPIHNKLPINLTFEYFSEDQGKMLESYLTKKDITEQGYQYGYDDGYQGLNPKTDVPACYQESYRRGYEAGKKTAQNSDTSKH